MFTLCHINPKYYPVGSLLILFWHREVINIYLRKNQKFSYMAFAIVVSFWNALPTQLLCKTLKHHHTRKLPFTFFMRIPEISFLCVKCRTSRYSCLTSRLALRGQASDLGCAFMCVWETLHLDRVSGGPEFWSLLCLLLEAISELELGLSSLSGDTCVIQPMLQVQAVRTMLPQSPRPARRQHAVPAGPGEKGPCRGGPCWRGWRAQTGQEAQGTFRPPWLSGAVCGQPPWALSLSVMPCSQERGEL